MAEPTIGHLRDSLTFIRAAGERAVSEMVDPSPVLGNLITQLERTVAYLRSHRDLVPLVGEIGDTLVSLVTLIRRQGEQVQGLQEALANARVQPSVATAADSGFSGQSGDDVSSLAGIQLGSSGLVGAKPEPADIDSVRSNGGLDPLARDQIPGT